MFCRLLQKFRIPGEVGGRYNDMIEYLPFLLRLYSSMRENGLGLQDATAALEYAPDWKKAEAKLRAIADAVVLLQLQKRA